jgi:hypothetical protein
LLPVNYSCPTDGDANDVDGTVADDSSGRH